MQKTIEFQTAGESEEESESDSQKESRSEQKLLAKVSGEGHVKRS